MDIAFVILVLMILSAYFSSTEIAYVAANRIKFEVKAKKNNFAAKNVLYFLKNPHDFFSTILIGNNIVNIALASLLALFLAKAFNMEDGEILLISTLIILFAGELIPKYFAREIPDLTILLFAIPLRALSIIIFPFVKATSTVSEYLTKSETLKEETTVYLFDKRDIQLLAKETAESKSQSKEEGDLVARVLELREQRVYEVMRPRTEIAAIEIGSSLQEAQRVFIESGYSKLPVYEGSIDNVKGMVLTYDLFKFPSNIKSIIREIIFVPETKKSIEMLYEFLAKRSSIAIVVDEFGGTAGIISIEDIIEELFGEIKDEYDVDEEICRKIDDSAYIIGGKAEIDLINEKFSLNLPKEDYETLAGYIIYKMGRIPKQGETVSIDQYNFLIVRATQTKIDLVKMIISESS